MVDAGETFSPYYADAVVNYVLETHRGDEDETRGWRRCECTKSAAGRGRLVTGFLDAMRRRAPKVYEKMRYTSIDISKTLVDAQRARAGGRAREGCAHRRWATRRRLRRGADKREASHYRYRGFG